MTQPLDNKDGQQHEQKKAQSKAQQTNAHTDSHIVDPGQANRIAATGQAAESTSVPSLAGVQSLHVASEFAAPWPDRVVASHLREYEPRSAATLGE